MEFVASITADYPTVSGGILTFVSGLVLFHSLLKAFQCLLKTATALDDQRTIGIAVMLVSSTFAIACCSTSLHVIRNYRSSVMWDSHPIIHHFLVFGISYFVYDLQAMYQAYTKQLQAGDDPLLAAPLLNFVRARPLMIFHHILIPLFAVSFLLMPVKRGDYFIAIFILMEGSTPFVSMRRILELLEMKSSWIYVVNGIMMTVTFFLCRIANLVYIYFLYSQELDLPLVEIFVHRVPMHCNLCALAITALQLYWWSLMLKGLAKFLTKKEKPIKTE